MDVLNATSTTAMNPLERMNMLIHPYGMDEFLEHYFEKGALHIPRDQFDYFTELLNCDEIDRLLQCTAISRSLVRVAKDGHELFSESFTANGEPTATSISNERLLALFGSGHTIIIEAGDRVFPNLDHFCRCLEHELQFRIQPNVYITPYDSRGFATHYDDHDVFVLQVMGSKKWKLFHSPVELPSRAQRHIGGNYRVDQPAAELTLHPGDTLYLPRGLLHEADTGSVASAHIALGLHPTYRFQLVQECARVARELPEFRKSIPYGLLDDQEILRASKEVKRLLLNLVDKMEFDKLLESRRADFVANSRPEYRNRFRDLVRLHKLNLDTVVRRRESALYSLKKDEHGISVEYAGNTIVLQPFLESAIAPILNGKTILVRDIEGLLSDQGRVELARKFVHAGFLEILELNEDESPDR